MRGRVLVDAGQLARSLASDRPPVIADVRWTLGGPPGLADFEVGHIPGAHWVDLERELSARPSGPGGRHPLPDVRVFESAMRRIGVTTDSAVVVYDAGTSLAASRLWWLLTDAGHQEVRVLDGGLAAWQAAELPVERGAAGMVTPGDFSARPGHRRRVGATEVLASLDSAAPEVVVDVRAPERYSGQSEPVDPVAGHIPGAVNLPSMANVDAVGRFRDEVAIASRYREAGVTASAVIYCGSGVTAAHTLLALAHAGMADAVLYPGSWSDWVSDPTRPVATGNQPDGGPAPVG